MNFRIIIISLFAFCFFSGSNDYWTSKQLAEAGTADTLKNLSLEEKEIIRYLNLARLYPKDFARIELKSSIGNTANIKSLRVTLNSMKPVSALRFNHALYENAKCFSKELGETGRVTHKRLKCPRKYSAECCDFGNTKGLDIILNLLIDEDIADLGHRVICLDSRYSQIGVSNPHTSATHARAASILSNAQACIETVRSPMSSKSQSRKLIFQNPALSLDTPLHTTHPSYSTNLYSLI